MGLFIPQVTFKKRKHNFSLSSNSREFLLQIILQKVD